MLCTHSPFTAQVPRLCWSSGTRSPRRVQAGKTGSRGPSFQSPLDNTHPAYRAFRLSKFCPHIKSVLSIIHYSLYKNKTKHLFNFLLTFVTLISPRKYKIKEKTKRKVTGLYGAQKSYFKWLQGLMEFSPQSYLISFQKVSFYRVRGKPYHIAQRSVL